MTGVHVVIIYASSDILRKARNMTMTVKEAKRNIQDLIDEFPDDDYLKCLEEMIDLATTARDARLEEMEEE